MGIGNSGIGWYCPPLWEPDSGFKVFPEWDWAWEVADGIGDGVVDGIKVTWGTYPASDDGDCVSAIEGRSEGIGVVFVWQHQVIRNSELHRIAIIDGIIEGISGRDWASAHICDAEGYFIIFEAAVISLSQGTHFYGHHIFLEWGKYFELIDAYPFFQREETACKSKAEQYIGLACYAIDEVVGRDPAIGVARPSGILSGSGIC